jgi:hypothetical protein
MAEVLSVEAVLEDGRLVRGAGAARQLRAAPPSHVQCRGEGAVQLHARPLLKEHPAMKTEYRESGKPEKKPCMLFVFVRHSDSFLPFRLLQLINRRCLDIF